MVKIVVESFGEDALRKLFCDLSHKEDWDEECSLCSMPTLLHKGSCSRKAEIGEAEHSDLWKSWSLFRKNMEPIRKEYKEEMDKKLRNSELLKGLQEMTAANQKRLQEMTEAIMSGNRDRPNKLVKPAKVPSWSKDQLTNKNFLSPIGFVFVLDKAKKVSFLCQRASIPEMSLGQVDIPTAGYAKIPMSGNIEYSQLTLDFIVDEDLRNYMEIHNWIRALGTPQDYIDRMNWNDQYRMDTRSKTDDAKWSDATLLVLNNNNIANFDVVFQSLWPVSLSTVAFDVTGTDNEFMTATATFNYSVFEVRNQGSRDKR